MKGTEKQVKWAQDLYNRLYAGYQSAEAKLIEPEADAWTKAVEHGQKLVDKYSKEDRSWIIIDELKTMSKDPEKAAKQIQYLAKISQAEKQKAEV